MVRVCRCVSVIPHGVELLEQTIEHFVFSARLWAAADTPVSRHSLSYIAMQLHVYTCTMYMYV